MTKASAQAERVQKLTAEKIDARIERAMVRLGGGVPFDFWGDLKALILPELYAGGGKPSASCDALPGTDSKREVQSGRASRREAITCPGDRDILDHEATVAELPVTVDEFGRKHPRGNCSKNAHTVDDVPVDRAYADVRTATLPEVSVQQYRAFGERAEKVAAPSGPRVTSPQVLGPRIRHFRESKRLTLGQVAKRSGLSRMAISLIERGKCDPKRESLQRLAWALKLGVDELIGPHAA